MGTRCRRRLAGGGPGGLFALATLGLLAGLPAICGQAEGKREEASTRSAAETGPTEAALIARLLREPSGGEVLLRLAGGDTVHVGRSATEFYRGRGWSPAWTGAGKLTRRGRALLGQLGRTEDDGLSPERYHYATARRLASWLGSGHRPGRSLAAKLDVLLSEGFARYADDLAGGTLDPKQAGLEWHLPRERAPKVQALQMIASGIRPDSVVSHLRPHTLEYGRMMRALAHYRVIAARGGWPRIATASSRRSGTVVAVRARLMAGEDSVDAALAAVGRARPGTLDADLREAIVRFQKRVALPADGRIGPATIKALNVPVEQRMQLLAINMDRWRWMPRDPGPLYVLINLPAFDLVAMQGDSAIMRQKVVVGKPGWTTPVFADRIVQIIVNPYWTVPRSIAAEELGPDIARDPSYLADHHFERLRDGGYRQLPGPDNALGLFKFELTNDEEIYLHDTPSKGLFGRPDRDLSHGCIRLQNARAMAYLIARREGIPTAAIARASASGKNRVFTLRHPIPVYIMYFTVDVKSDGGLVAYPDVYGLDRPMAALVPQLRGLPVDAQSLARDFAASHSAAQPSRYSRTNPWPATCDSARITKVPDDRDRA